MTLSLTTITGPLYMPDGLRTPFNGRLAFEMSSYDTEENVGGIVHGPVYAEVDENGDFSIDLYTTTLGTNNVTYRLYAMWPNDKFTTEYNQQQFETYGDGSFIKKYLGSFALSGSGPWRLDQLSLVNELTLESFDVYQSISAMRDEVAAYVAQIPLEDEIRIKDSDYIDSTQMALIRANNIDAQDEVLVTAGVQSMMNAAMVKMKSGKDVVVRVVCSGSFAVNDEVFSESFANDLWLWNSGANGNTDPIFSGDARFHAKNWLTATRPRTSGFYLEQGITDSVPTAMFRWEQRSKQEISPKIEGWEMHGEKDIETDPIGFKLRNINMFDMLLKAEGCAQGGLHISDMNNGAGGEGIQGEVSRCGGQITGAGGSGFLPADVRIATTASSTTMTLVDDQGVAYAGPFGFLQEHVGKEICVTGVGDLNQAMTTTIVSVESTGEVTVDRAAVASAASAIFSFTYMPVSATAGSTTVWMMPHTSLDLTGRYVGVTGAGSSLHTEIGTPFTRVVAHNMTTGELTLARPARRTVADAALITGPGTFFGKDDDQVTSDGVTPESGHNNDVRISLRIECGSLGYPSINMFGQNLLGVQFIGTKWHGLGPGTLNFGANWTAMFLDTCKAMQALGCQIEWGGHSAKFGKVSVTGARNHIAFDTVHMGDYLMSDCCALVYTHPDTNGQENCRVSFGAGSFLNAEFFPSTNQVIHRAGGIAAGSIEHVQGELWQRNGTFVGLTRVQGNTQIIGDTPVLTLRDQNQDNRGSRFFHNGSEFRIDKDDTGNGVFDINILRHTTVDGLQFDFGSGWETFVTRGTFTPEFLIGGVLASTFGGVYSNQVGEYQVVAGICWVRIGLTLSTLNTSGSGVLEISLPSVIRPAEYNDALNVGLYENFTGINRGLIIASGGGSSDKLILRQHGSGGSGYVSLQDTNLTAGARLEISGSFRV